MSDGTQAEGIDRATARHTTQNIRLAGRFFQRVLADPAILDEVPDGATVVLLPDDDPRLAAANLRMADRLIDAGKAVRLQRAGGHHRTRHVRRLSRGLVPRSGAARPGGRPTRPRTTAPCRSSAAEPATRSSSTSSPADGKPSPCPPLAASRAPARYDCGDEAPRE